MGSNMKIQTPPLTPPLEGRGMPTEFIPQNKPQGTPLPCRGGAGVGSVFPEAHRCLCMLNGRASPLKLNLKLSFKIIPDEFSCKSNAKKLASFAETQPKTMSNS